MDDVAGVLDAAASESAALFGVSDGEALCLRFAATCLERVRSVLTFGAWARRTRAADYPWTATQEQRETRYQDILDTWGTTTGLGTIFPSLIGDPSFEEWMGIYSRAAASPAAAVALLRMNSEVDIRPILGTVRVPSLIMNRLEDTDVKGDEARYIASQIPRATLKLFAGADHVPWAGRTDDILGEVEQFLTAARHAVDDRILATALSTGIAASTELPTRLGDRHGRDML